MTSDTFELFPTRNDKPAPARREAAVQGDLFATDPGMSDYTRHGEQPSILATADRDWLAVDAYIAAQEDMSGIAEAVAANQLGG